MRKSACSAASAIAPASWSIPISRPNRRRPPTSPGSSALLHAIGVEFAQSIAARGEEALPWHRADKKVSCLCPTSGAALTPDEPNAVKLERFVFDAMGQATRPAILEVERTEEFAPIKNATGIDSAESSKQLQSDLYGTWLERAGVTIPRRADGHVDAAIEISPLTASVAADLQGMALPESIASGSVLAL